MAINEITKDGKVTELEVNAPTLNHATVLATEWCEENNCILKEVKLNERVYIVEVCSDDYEWYQGVIPCQIFNYRFF